MKLSARHNLDDFTYEIDFATRRILDVAGSGFGPVWNDLDKGTGYVCVAGTANGQPLLRFYQTVGEVSYATVPIDADHSQVNANGRVSSYKGAGQILLNDPKPDVGEQKADVQKALAFLRKLFTAYEPVWIRSGTTWPVALLKQRVGNPLHWAFVQVPTRLGDVQQAVVELCLTTEQLKEAIPLKAGRPAPHSFG